MTPPEFSRGVALDTLSEAPRTIAIEADAGERAALAVRFGLIEIVRLSAEFALRRKGDAVTASGAVTAAVLQSCVASAEPVAAEIDEHFTMAFQPAASGAEGEIELGESELDTIFYEGASIDIGEAAAQTLLLALNPYPRAPQAEETLKGAGVKSEEDAHAEASLFAALKPLKGKSD